jgi:hypothetical protein
MLSPLSTNKKQAITGKTHAYQKKSILQSGGSKKTKFEI